MIKRLLCVVLACLMLLTLPATPAEAKGADEVAAALAALQRLMPEGTYWNHRGTSYRTYNQDRFVHNLRSTTTPCYHSEGHCSSYYYSGACGCNSFEGSTQCMGFARFICAFLFGSAPNGDGHPSGDWVKTTFDDLRPGDYIRYRATPAYYGHSVVVMEKGEDYIVIAECNRDRHCGISWDRVLTKEVLEDCYVINYLHHIDNTDHKLSARRSFEVSSPSESGEEELLYHDLMSQLYAWADGSTAFAQGDTLDYRQILPTYWHDAADQWT